MKNIIKNSYQIIATCLIAMASVVNAHDAVDDKQSIRHVINSTYDTPQHKVLIDPIVIQGNHAVASWIQQDKGGRVVLYRSVEGAWDIVLCSGKAVTETDFLVKTGISKAEADLLATELASAETKLGSEKIALFDSFKGVVRGTHQADHGKDHGHQNSSKTHSHH
ncbi:MAG: copper uptake system-associated protein [Cellvibrio sp.]|uniref:copper uptake system-associated protein n=1 Tax=Cellvibrio sp. TaxID=1965322 RepID=UPI0031A57D70